MASDVTQRLSAIERGNPHAADQLLPYGYEEPAAGGPNDGP